MAAAADSSAVTIEPRSFDVVVCGTGLPESILAAACAAAGKTVLHVDPNPFYGSHFSSSVPPHALPSFLLSSASAACAAAGKTVLHVDPNPFYGSHFSSSVPPHALPSFLLSSASAACAAAGKTVLHVDPTPSTAPTSPPPSPPRPPVIPPVLRLFPLHTLPSFLLSSASSPSTPSSDAGVVPLQRRSSLYSDIETSGTVPSEGSFAVDLVGPRLLYCADEAVDLLHRSGGGHHVEFKSVDLLYWDHGDLFPVPGSRQNIFNAKVDLVDKSRLSAFVRLVKSHIAANEREEGKASISEEDLNLPFVEFLKKQNLTLKIIGVVLYAIAMSDYDQEDAAADSRKTLLTTRDGMKTVALHFKSIGRQYFFYVNDEVLRMPVTALLMDKEKQRYIGTRLATGQDILCQQLTLDPSYEIPSLDLPLGASESNSPRTVARGICITKKSVKQNSSNVLVVFPPKSLQEQQVATLRVLQLGSNVAICPPGMFMAYLSIPCVDAYMGKLCINKAIEVLFGSQTSDGSEGHSEKTREDNDDAKPGLIGKCVYVQEITQAKPGPILSCPMPDEYLGYRNILESTEKLFAEIYPNEEFLPRNSAPQHEDDDSDSAE